MIKSFIIQAFIALMILVSSLTSSSANAAAISPARQFLFLFLGLPRRTLLTSNPEFAREYESPIFERDPDSASIIKNLLPLGSNPENPASTSVPSLTPVPAPTVLALRADDLSLQARTISVAQLFTGAGSKVANAVKKIAGSLTGGLS